MPKGGKCPPPARPPLNEALLVILVEVLVSDTLNLATTYVATINKSIITPLCSAVMLRGLQGLASLGTLAFQTSNSNPRGVITNT